MTEPKGLPPWVWVGCGCVGAILALVLVMAGIGFWGIQKARELGETMADPEARAERALEVLGAETLPEGYYAVATVSVPFVLDFTALSDQPPNPDGSPNEPGRRGFVFTSFPSLGDGDVELYDFFEGRTDDVDSLKREQFDIDLRERLARGRMERSGDELLWVAHRGAVRTDRGNADDGLVTMVLFECHDSRRRIGIWFGPDPSPEAPADGFDTRGTVADVSELELFLRPITPCE